MAQTVPATCVLGPGKTGLAIGLRVLNIDGTVYSAFSVVDVAETAVLGTYRKANGAIVPDAGGYIVWGTAATDYAEATVDSTVIPWNAAWDAEVQSEATDALNAYDPPTKAEMDTAIAAIPDPTVSISATTAAAVASGSLAIRTYHTFSQAITSTSTAALNTATKVWLAIKTRVSDADTASQVFIEAAGGLTVLGGAAYATTAHGTLVVTGSSGAWVITLGMDEVATGLLTAGSYVAEVKALVGANTVAVWDGTAVVSAGIVRAVT